jgi:N-acetylglucosamine transport system permease protein
MRRDRARTRFIISFLAPAVLLYAGFVVYPLIQALVLSLYRFRGVSRKKTFIGSENFQTLWNDDVFRRSALHNLALFACAGIVILLLALAVSHAVRGQGAIAKTARAVYLFPQIVSLVVVAVLWQFIFNPTGLLNSGLNRIGLDVDALPWLGNGTWALAAVGVAFVWWAAGFYIMLFEAGLKQIPQEVDEAAALDGSLGWHRFRTVTWPLLWSVKRIAVIYLVINTMNVFALVFLMTRGGPDHASEVMLTHLYEQAFVNSSFGYATAVAIGNFLVVMAMTLLILLVFRKNPVEGRR